MTNTTTTNNTRLNFRAPSTTAATIANDDNYTNFDLPPSSFLHGKWYVTHSTLPMWKSNRDVTITYTPLENNVDVLDDLVEYRPKNNPQRRKTVQGYDTPSADVSAAYGWRGKGWLKIASSKWQVLGYGEEDQAWCVTYFEKTLFTPAGIDVYSRRKEGLSEDMLRRIRKEIENIKDGNVQTLAGLLFEIEHT
ncbi:hypothetical protein H2204_011023 [Knufia peltigerae]|uniref:Uncharacterized protein n=1 Tax=Knufia peltigerae TaxID=1002370 RepID=A0AA38XV42_9EURO|nr:hypothetical protein H2204_011023 [Knufia peltigerae]